MLAEENVVETYRRRQYLLIHSDREKRVETYT
jgi:hypothetical protein